MKNCTCLLKWGFWGIITLTDSGVENKSSMTWQQLQIWTCCDTWLSQCASVSTIFMCFPMRYRCGRTEFWKGDRWSGRLRRIEVKWGKMRRRTENQGKASPKCTSGTSIRGMRRGSREERQRRHRGKCGNSPGCSFRPKFSGMFHLNGFHRVWNLLLSQNAMGCGTLGYLKKKPFKNNNHHTYNKLYP